MKKELLDSLGQLLRQQRSHFLQEFRKAEEGLETTAAEREIELEEHAQEEQIEQVLTRLDDQTLHNVREIDAALQRIIDGSYGKCESCDKPIAIARLRSLPATRFCHDCGERNEKPAPTELEASEAPSEEPVPADMSLLNNEELTEATLEYLREDRRVDMHELNLVCHKGVAYLSGKVPSEAEHQILLRTLTEELDFKEIVDRLDVERQL